MIRHAAHVLSRVLEDPESLSRTADVAANSAHADQPRKCRGILERDQARVTSVKVVCEVASSSWGYAASMAITSWAGGVMVLVMLSALMASSVADT
jgi:hypothetical protein